MVEGEGTSYESEETNRCILWKKSDLFARNLTIKGYKLFSVQTLVFIDKKKYLQEYIQTFNVHQSGQTHIELSMK